MTGSRSNSVQRFMRVPPYCFSSPTSALTDDLDDFSEPICRMPPVGFHRDLGRIRATFVNRIDDCVMLVHTGPDVTCEHADIHPDVALGLRFYGVVQRNQ